LASKSGTEGHFSVEGERRLRISEMKKLITEFFVRVSLLAAASLPNAC
jgi:hypothetical protein